MMTLRDVVRWLVMIINLLAIGVFGYAVYKEIVAGIYEGVSFFNEDLVKIALVSIALFIVNFFVLLSKKK